MLKSNFSSDLKKEQKLFPFLDAIYTDKLRHYTFKRVSDYKAQLKGIDIVFTHNTTRQDYLIDEKAQLDYINDDLPTFAFEIQYEKKGRQKEGWLFDNTKETHFYSLITALFEDSPDTFTSCKITLVNRDKLIAFLAAKKITKDFLMTKIEKRPHKHAKLVLDRLNPKTEGYLYFSTKNKAEKPVNLILRLEYLIRHGIAKRLV